MLSKNNFVYTQLLIKAVVVGMLLFCISPSSAFSMEDPKPDGWEDIQMVGVIGPDGRTNLWAVSTSSAGDVFGLLAVHPSRIKAGIRYYRLSSWQDMCGVLTAVNRHQARVLRQLAQDVQQLTKRVGQIERKSRKVIYSGPLNYRLKRLEEKLQSMTDGGNP